MEERVYDSMVVFDEAIKIADNDEPIYGFVFYVGDCTDEMKDELEANIRTYIQYLSLLNKWFSDGGTVDENNSSVFYDANGVVRYFSLEDDFFVEYMARANAEYPIHYTIRFYCCTKFGEEYLDENFIIKRLEVEV